MSLEDDWTPPEDKKNGQGEHDFDFSLALDVTFDINSIPGGEEAASAAATTIQLAWRQRAARVEARRRLAKVYVKRPAPGGGVYYEHTVSGESQWERPLCAARWFPNSSW